jgi:hypothetical protein
MNSQRHPTQEELLRGAIRAIEEILAPELQSAWARATAVQLKALLHYTLKRQERDLQAEQDAELAAALGALTAAHPALAALTGSVDARDSAALREATGALLVYAQQHADAAAAAIRAELRPIVVRHCAEDLEESAPLLQAFMTSGRGGAAGVE